MSRPFVFRLERVRRVRQGVEDRAREELATSLAARRDTEAAAQQASERLDWARDGHRRVASVPGASGDELRHAQAYLERLEAERLLAAHDLDRREAEVGERRHALQEAARDRKALDRLRERRRLAHALEAQRAAAATLDEIALRMHSRKATA